MPNLASTVDSLDQVPEAARPFYIQKDGKYVVALDGAPSGFVSAADLATANGKIVEFRDNNIALAKEVETLRPLKSQFEGIDPIAAKDAIAKVAELGKKGVKGEDDVQKLVTSAVEAALKPVKEQLTASQQATETERKRADESTLRQTITAQFLKAGGKAKAVDFIVTQAASAFKVENGVVAAQPNKFSTERPGEPLGVEEWIGSLTKEHDYAFASSTGSGAAPANGGASQLRPGQQVLRDPTPQQLGEFATKIAKGEYKVEYTNK